MAYTVRQMSIEDYDQVHSLWEKTDSVILSRVDSREGIKKFLERNPGLSFVAIVDGRIVGVVMCSHDGRLGYMSHLAVDHEHRRLGIGRQLVGRCVYALTGQGIQKCILLIMKETPEAQAFWRNVDQGERVSLVMMVPR